MDIAWRPSERYLARSRLRRFAEEYGHGDFASLYRWSVEDLDGFWRAVDRDRGPPARLRGERAHHRRRRPPARPGGADERDGRRRRRPSGRPYGNRRPAARPRGADARARRVVG